MPRYRFNVLDGTGFIDENGVELPSIDAAKREARRYAGLMLADSAEVSKPDRDWRVEVVDDQGQVLFRLAVSMMDLPEAKRDQPT